MDLNYILLWMVGISAASTLYRCYQLERGGPHGRKIACILLLGLVGIGIFLFPDVAGYVAGVPWVVLILLPSLAVRRLQRLIVAEDYKSAANTARLLSWLNPFNNWREITNIYTATGLAKAGSLDAATEMLERYRHSKLPHARLAFAQIYRLQERWAEFLAWLDEEMSPAEIARNPSIELLRLRAWGETGQLDRLVAGFKDLAGRFHGIPTYRNTARLYLLAFFGRADLLPGLFEGPLRNYSPSIHARWLAKARDAQARLAASPEEAAQGAAVIDKLAGELSHETRYSAPAVQRFRPVATSILIGINVAVFCVEILLGGSTEDSVLVRMGALLPGLFTVADSWRLVAASFLHIGPLHLAMNMFALWVLGPFVERILRPLRYLVCYLGAGIGSMAMVVVLYRLGFVHYGLLAGASGAIMGLVGATAAIALRDSRVLKTSASFARLRWAGTVILIQIAFDASTPQVSMAAHLGGCACGFLLTLLLSGGS